MLWLGTGLVGARQEVMLITQHDHSSLALKPTRFESIRLQHHRGPEEQVYVRA